MHFDSTVTLGSLLTLTVNVVAILIVAWRIGLRFEKMEWKVNLIWRSYAKEHDLGNGNGEEKK